MENITTVETLIYAEWVIPVVPHNSVLSQHAIAINDSKIVDILPSDKARQIYRAQNIVELPNQVLMPGLINSHGHAAMTLFRGLADDYPLMTWLEDYIWPAEQTWIDEEFVKDGTELAIAEMLRSGTTCFSDMYFFPNKTAEAAHQAGIRSQITFPVFDFPSAWGRDANDYIHKGLQLRDDFKHSQYIEIGFGPHAPYTVSDEPLQRVAMYAAELDSSVHMHIHETAHEVQDAISQNGERPLQRLNRLGLLSPRMQCVHMTELNDEDIDLIGTSGAHIIHCPESNLKLASGFCPVDKLLKAGINVALGTDGAASNNDLDMFSELRSAAMLAKAVSGDATAVPAHQALQMATINGAIAMGLQDKIGSLETGKYADVISIDLSDIESQPIYDPASHLVYTNCSHKVSNVWIAGRQVLAKRQPTTLNLIELSEKATIWRDKIAASSKH